MVGEEYLRKEDDKRKTLVETIGSNESYAVVLYVQMSTKKYGLQMPKIKLDAYNDVTTCND